MAPSISVSEALIAIAMYQARGGFARSTTPHTRCVTAPKSSAPSTSSGRW